MQTRISFDEYLDGILAFVGLVTGKLCGQSLNDFLVLMLLDQRQAVVSGGFSEIKFLFN